MDKEIRTKIRWDSVCLIHKQLVCSLVFLSYYRSVIVIHKPIVFFFFEGYINPRDVESGSNKPNDNVQAQSCLDIGMIEC